ncbi:MAG TPA: TatD family deoxyribonuclease [Candidatus Parcubacteria bacterium]|nr:TatD family deoxyribonuclease [Candidatus Parcubacteria bacterium]
MLIDSHAHLNFSAFDKDRKKIIKECLDSDLWMINVGTKYETGKKAKEIAESYKRGVYATVGLHPIHVKNGLKIKMDPQEGGFIPKGEDFDRGKYEKLAESKKVVAIGEIGLDYYYFPKGSSKEEIESLKNRQKEVLFEQIRLANDLDLPIIFHCRKAHDDLIELLEASNLRRIKSVVHSFTGKWRQAENYLKMGFYLGFNGLIFRLNLDKIIERIPLDKILIETDAPFLTPPEFPEKRNNPFGVKFVAEKIAGIKKINYEEVANITFKNAKRLFGI